MAATIGTAIATATSRLMPLCAAIARHEAERLLSLATGLTHSQLLAWPERPLAPAMLHSYAELVARRAAGEPMAYLRGRQPFWTLELQVSPATLIPRPETERLVELALERLPAERPLRVADLGTGCGAIALAIASERPRWQIIATDISAQALAMAERNRSRLGLANMALLQGDWLSPLGDAAFDAVLSNPPYVRENDPHLLGDGLPYEPRSALVGGRDGLAAIRRIIIAARPVLRPGALLALEHGADQGEQARLLMAEAGYQGIDTCRDLGGLERVTYAIRADHR